MNDTTKFVRPKFVIPTGTRIHTRNVMQDLRMRPHVTRKELSFDDRTNTGDGGSLYYFQQGSWLISVDASQVRDVEKEGFVVSDSSEKLNSSSVQLLPMPIPQENNMAAVGM